MAIENVIIVGSGPSAYTAAIYASRASLNPLILEGEADSSKRVDIPFNPVCSDAQAVDGWNVDRGRVRICGKSCFDIRYMYGFGAVYAMDRHAAPPDVVVKWAPRCR